jgi:hypothetical protein
MQNIGRAGMFWSGMNENEMSACIIQFSDKKQQEIV